MQLPFTRRFEDLSTEAGYQFAFYCDLCNEGFHSEFMPAQHALGLPLRDIAQGCGLLEALILKKQDASGLGDSHGRRPNCAHAWQEAHGRAFDAAQAEAQNHFYCCPGCRRWVCAADLGENGLCVECSRKRIGPGARSALAPASAPSAARTSDRLPSITALCSSCRRPTPDANFCTHCGAPLHPNACHRCGANLLSAHAYCFTCGAPQAGQRMPAIR